jgi:hypothetical protein
MRSALALFAAFALTASVSTAQAAAPCRDAKGKFIKCPAPTASIAAGRCKDAQGRFRICGTPGAHPVK